MRLTAALGLVLDGSRVQVSMEEGRRWEGIDKKSKTEKKNWKNMFTEEDENLPTLETLNEQVAESDGFGGVNVSPKYKKVYNGVGL